MKKDISEVIAKKTFIVLVVICIAYAASVFIFIL
tara:strand:+ start:599 stop:700 length:102 start_codon:yes stop_codon:yes gene_type:complete